VNRSSWCACVALLGLTSARARALDDAPAALASAAASSPAAGRPLWSTNGAPTIPKGRWELALLSTSRHGLADGLELAVQPFVFFTLPHAGLKLRAHERGPLTLSVAARVSYPSPFLSLVSREGAGGLLPETTDVPFAIGVELDAIASYRFAAQHLASARLGLAVAPHAHSDDLPLLDFPFLYPRFAPLYTSVVPRLALGGEGRVAAGLHYAVDVTAYILPLEAVDGYALEPAAELEYRFGDHVALAAGVRMSLARYPVGTRFHHLPHLDVRVGFF
jgi:hypothetical protein